MNVTKDLCGHDKTFKSQVAPVVNRAKYTSERRSRGASHVQSIVKYTFQNETCLFSVTDWMLKLISPPSISKT